LSMFRGCLLVFIALLGSLAEVDILMLFMFVQGELHTVDFLLGHTAALSGQIEGHTLGYLHCVYQYPWYNVHLLKHYDDSATQW
jgi:hypothetical protein